MKLSIQDGQPRNLTPEIQFSTPDTLSKGSTARDFSAEIQFSSPKALPQDTHRVEVSDSSENILPPGCNYSKPKLDLSKSYDLCIVGAGLSGTVFAERSSELEESVLVIDSRPHIGGNCYDYIDQKTGVLRNQYGSHLFHTRIQRVWDYVNNPRSPPWKQWYHMKYGIVNGTYVPIPVNIMTVNRLFNVNIQTED